MNKGFTLVELLAVVVILSAIVLITRPIVLSIVNESKKEIMLRTAESYSTILEDSFTEYVINNTNISDGTYYIMHDGNVCLGLVHENECYGDVIKINTEKSLPTKGNILYENQLIKELVFVYDNQVIYKNNGKLVFEDNIEKPNLSNNTLVPVVYNGNNWVVADEKELWYNYRFQEWANAVILRKNLTKKVGDIVTVDGSNPDAVAMFVWIPRYEYKIDGTYGKGSTSNQAPGEIDINFISKSQTKASEGYRIHPAFTFGTKQLSGIWVGKFETSYNEYGDYEAYDLNCRNTTCSSADYLKILPNAKSLRQNKVSSFFFLARSMSRSNNPFKIDSSKLDTHMMKNSEWGAVAYLSQSRYGKYGNNYYQGPGKEVYINNSNKCYTGRSGGSAYAVESESGTYEYDYDLINVKYEGIKNENVYPWEEIENGFKSTNHNHSTSSHLTLSFNLNTPGTISFDWSVSGESCCDYVYYTIKKDGVTLSDTGTSTKIVGTSYGSNESSLRYVPISKNLDPGNYEIIFTYRKDGSVNSGLDTAYVKNFKVNDEFLGEVLIVTENGVGASTTGNITGVYDMSGGAHEYVMGVFANSSGTLWSGASSSENSGFTGRVSSSANSYSGLSFPNSKYYDVYKAYSGTTIDISNACNNATCYGHALSETLSWYSDSKVFVNADAPWILRGGAYNDTSSAGIFKIQSIDGSYKWTRSFRIVMSPTS